jgi:hypothetical protein
MNRILFMVDEKSTRLLYNDGITEEGYHVITSDDSQPLKSPDDKIILPHLFKEQIEQGIKKLCNDLKKEEGGL